MSLSLNPTTISAHHHHCRQHHLRSHHNNRGNGCSYSGGSDTAASVLSHPAITSNLADIHSIDSRLKHLISTLHTMRTSSPSPSPSLEHGNHGNNTVESTTPVASDADIDAVLRAAIDVIDRWIVMCNRERRIISLRDKRLVSFFSELCKRKQFSRTEALLQRILRLRRWDMYGVVPYTDIFNVIIFHLARFKQHHEAVRVYRSMQNTHGLLPNTKTLHIVAQVYRVLQQPERAIALIEAFWKSSTVAFDAALLNYLIELYREQRDVDSLVHVLDELVMTRKSPIVNEMTYSITAKAFAENGRISEVAPLLLRLHQHGPGIDRYTYSIILDAMLNQGDVLDAYQMHEMIAEKNIVLDKEIFNKLLSMLIAEDMIGHNFYSLLIYMEKTDTLDVSTGMSIARALAQRFDDIGQIMDAYHTICDISERQRQFMQHDQQSNESMEDDMGEERVEPLQQLEISDQQFFIAAFEGFASRLNTTNLAITLDDMMKTIRIPITDELMNNVLQTTLDSGQTVVAAKAAKFLLIHDCFTEHSAQIVCGNALDKLDMRDAHNEIDFVFSTLQALLSHWAEDNSSNNMREKLFRRILDEYPRNSIRYFVVMAAVIQKCASQGNVKLVETMVRELVTRMQSFVDEHGLTGYIASVLDAAVCTVLRVFAKRQDMAAAQELFLSLLKIGAQPHASTICHLAMTRANIVDALQVYEQLAAQFMCKKTPHVYLLFVKRCIDERAYSTLRDLLAEMDAANIYLPDMETELEARELSKLATRPVK